METIIFRDPVFFWLTLSIDVSKERALVEALSEHCEILGDTSPVHVCPGSRSWLPSAPDLEHSLLAPVFVSGWEPRPNWG